MDLIIRLRHKGKVQGKYHSISRKNIEAGHCIPERTAGSRVEEWLINGLNGPCGCKYLSWQTSSSTL